jgi:hypothetical protein
MVRPSGIAFTVPPGMDSRPPWASSQASAASRMAAPPDAVPRVSVIQATSTTAVSTASPVRAEPNAASATATAGAGAGPPVR